MIVCASGKVFAEIPHSCRGELDPSSYCDIKGPSHVAGNRDGGEKGLIIVLFLLALHVLASKCPVQGLPLERLANSQVILTWRSALLWGLLKGWGGPLRPQGVGARSVAAAADPRRKQEKAKGSKWERTHSPLSPGPLLDRQARCPHPPTPLSHWDWQPALKEQRGQETAAGPQLGAGQLAHRTLRMGGNLFWMCDPDGGGARGGERSKIRRYSDLTRKRGCAQGQECQIALITAAETTSPSASTARRCSPGELRTATS